MEKISGVWLLSMCCLRYLVCDLFITLRLVWGLLEFGSARAQGTMPRNIQIHTFKDSSKNVVIEVLIYQLTIDNLMHQNQK